ncbi:MAG: sialate O-acetylesterase [Terracidiphilus sp.]|jgi:sialate O-acetylesterase
MPGRIAAALCCLFLYFSVDVSAEVKPAALFSDHMVLQRGMSVPVWGMAAPGEAVKVTLNGQTRSTTAGHDGKWMLRLRKLKAGGPYEMRIQGTNSLIIHDVLVGEVWLGSGQSNMAFTVSKKAAYYAGMLDEDKEIAAANYPTIRMFMVKEKKSYTPLEDVSGEWKVCSPETVPGFSAVGYLFARDLQQRLHVPVGILTVAYGASTAEAWVPREAVAADPQMKPMLDRFDALEDFYKTHPGATTAEAPPPPQTINGRSVRPGPMRDPVEDQHEPTVLFNGMLHPVVPYGIRGAIWYQGESIVGGKEGLALYPHVMETMVTEWRKLWGEGDFPFYAVQLPALKNVSNNPLVREGQAQILMLPNTGLAVAIDVGDPDNVHPKNKAPVGERLALIALANVYGRKLEFSGPRYSSMKTEGHAIRIRFTHVDGGLVARDGPLKWFQIAGENHQFVDAEATIEGDSVLVKSDKASTPVAVRYAWANYPIGCNLFNATGLPAAPFRTDAWDAMTEIAKEFTGK